ncbi:SDR family oxidoreductase [Occultella gossypii]|uniref:SDR family oxidoreductase n=1 Tax=Occultella gossypii TaxID=2800820 RepID=A0ABS7SHT5_9MICO|nr:SDR family oxidoreductase [Occultella gossypii]MBZ2198866.1 SDR family oxidoreductase [Occultella gossypii]
MDKDTSPRTWLITGATSGLGRALATAALEAGENVVGTARRRGRFQDLTARYPRLLPVEHDVRDTERARGVVDEAIAAFGRVDVLVNNAGQGQVGVAEEIGDVQLRDMIEQHLLGPAALVRAVLPAMRERRSGTIVQMSSQGGRLSFPGVGSYSAGKFALEGWSEALAGEVRPFGIRVLVVEPSRFRTAFNAPDVLHAARADAAYGHVAAVRANMRDADGAQEGDPTRAASVIREVLEMSDPPFRLPLGAEAVRNLIGTYERNLVEVRRMAPIGESADFPGLPPAVRAL